jgi:septal ring factor EnvC (AmiA/AmiB activator)
MDVNLLLTNPLLWFLGSSLGLNAVLLTRDHHHARKITTLETTISSNNYELQSVRTERDDHKKTQEETINHIKNQHRQELNRLNAEIKKLLNQNEDPLPSELDPPYVGE